MIKFLLLGSMVFYSNAFSQDTNKPDPNSQVNAEEQVHGLPGGSKGTAAFSVRTKKRSVKMPSVIAPVENNSAASCASNLGGKGSANFTACEAAKKTR